MLGRSNQLGCAVQSFAAALDLELGPGANVVAAATALVDRTLLGTTRSVSAQHDGMPTRMDLDLSSAGFQTGGGTDAEGHSSQRDRAIAAVRFAHALVSQGSGRHSICVGEMVHA